MNIGCFSHSLLGQIFHEGLKIVGPIIGAIERSALARLNDMVIGFFKVNQLIDDADNATPSQ